MFIQPWSHPSLTIGSLLVSLFFAPISFSSALEIYNAFIRVFDEKIEMSGLTAPTRSVYILTQLIG